MCQWGNVFVEEVLGRHWKFVKYMGDVARVTRDDDVHGE